MKVMVIGSGGREHAIVHKLAQSSQISKLYALPGNGGIASEAECVAIGATDIDAIVEFARASQIEFAVVAPDDPLVLGAVDALEAVGVKCFGPNKAAAIIEGSKVFSKNLMKKYNIPTAAYETFNTSDAAKEYIRASKLPIVIKADGLALGKGVIIATTLDEALEAVDMIMEDKVFGKSGNSIVVEEFLTGPEVSVLCFTDGKTVVPMVSSMDHKRALDNDEGLNTGGMGTVAPNPCYTPKIAEECMQTIFLPTINAMNSENRTFKGCLYFGLMITPDGPKVIEYNCRFGDPETQVVLPLLKSDLFDVMRACANETLADCRVEFSEGSACCVVVASDGYPKSYKSGFAITLGSMDADCFAYHAGTKLNEEGKLVTSGGRVAGITAVAPTLGEAVQKAYAATDAFSFDNKYKRNDIGKRALSILNGEM